MIPEDGRGKGRDRNQETRRMGAKSDTAKRPRDPCSQTTGLHKESEKLGVCVCGGEPSLVPGLESVE